MKILIITQAVDAEDPVLGFFVRWIEEFAKNVERCEVICLRAGTYTLPASVRVHSLGKEKDGSRARYILNFYRQLWNLRYEYDTVFVHMNPEYFVLAGVWWRWVGTRTALWYTHKNVNLWLRIAVFFADHVLTASKESFRLSTNKLIVMGHGIDTLRPVPAHIPRSTTVRLMTSGRIARAKHLDVLISAFLALKKSGMVVTFNAFGAPTSLKDEAYNETLRTSLVQAGEDPDRILVGSVPHALLPERRAAMDYFLHASDTGSLDKAVLDAIMSGVIPVSSSEAYRELFGQHAPFLLYPPRNAAALADRIMALEALTEDEREAIRASLRTRVIKEHSLQALVPAILTVLQT